MNNHMISDKDLKEAAEKVRTAMLRSIPTAEEFCHTFSPDFCAKIDILIQSESRRINLRRTGRKIAAVFLAILISLGAWLLVDTEARASFFTWIKEVYETHIVYRFTGDIPSGTLPEYRLGWLPEGYEEALVVESDSVHNVLYTNSSNDGIIFTYQHTHQGTLLELLTPENSETIYLADGQAAHYYRATDNDSTDSLIWIDTSTQIAYSISSALPLEDILHIAECITLVNLPK